MCRTSRHKTLCRTCVVNFQPCTSAQTNSTPDVTLTLTLTLAQPFGGLEVVRGSHAAPPRVVVAFFQQKTPGGRKASLDQ